MLPMVNAGDVPYLDGHGRRCGTGYGSGDTPRNLDGGTALCGLSSIDEEEALLLAAAQTSTDRCSRGEIAVAMVIGELSSVWDHDRKQCFVCRIHR